MKGLIFSIKRYSIHDGPGIRVTFFLKGCPLSCLWCHNPEGISPEPEMLKRVNRIGEREFERMETAGKYMTSSELMKIVEKERVFIDRSGGGVTFSGGEPLMQPGFLREMLGKCRSEGLHTVIDTSAQAPEEEVKRIIPLTDLFMIDLKHTVEEKHLQYTGVPMSLIRKNTGHILQKAKEVWLRIPIIPGMNDSEEDINRYLDYINGLKTGPVTRINLLPYHRTGQGKYKKLGRDSLMPAVEQPSQERMKELKKRFEETGIKTKIGG